MSFVHQALSTKTYSLRPWPRRPFPPGLGSLMTVIDGVLLLAAGCVAGTMNALAGGGSFITFPALLLAGLPSVAANASSTVALLPGSLASVYVYTTGDHRLPFLDLGSVRLPLVLAVSAAGGLLGAALLVWTPTRASTR
jgi:uncharacterized protein